MSVHIARNRLLKLLVLDHILVKHTSTATKLQENKPHLLISCKRKSLDHYTNTYYDKLDDIPLASRGWKHSKSKNDHFTIHPYLNSLQEEMRSFTDFGIDNKIIENLKQQDINHATEFQSRAIPTIQSGVHTLLAAETGCGKTIAYLLPILQGLINSKSTALNTPKAIVVVPNRELAYQVGEMARAICESVGINIKVVVGGRTKKVMLNPVFEEIDLLVATPGALGKLSTVGVYKLNEVQWAVLDEADTLIDDSFIDRMASIIKRVANSQLILVSATLPRKFPDILYPYEATLEQVLSPKLHKPLLNITQKFLRITKSSKPSYLLQLAKMNKDPMLIFTNRNETCNWLAMFLRENGIPCSNINGDMHYALRIDQWNQFVRGETRILSATDVGSRGLNTIQVRHVLNYDFPLYAADYLHRIGRVGRLGSPQLCRATNFVAGVRELGLVQQIELAIRKDQPLNNVDGNITNIVQNKILRKMRDNS